MIGMLAFLMTRDGLNDDPFVQAVGSPTPARSRQNSLTLSLTD